MGAAESTGRPNGTTEREEEEQRRRRQLESVGSFMEKAATAATLAAGVAVAALGTSRILSDNTNSDEDRGDRFISTVTDRGYHYTKGQSSGYYGGVFGQDDGGSSDVAKQLSTWSPPPRGQFIMNTDGACKPHPGGLGGYGGILRNDRGDFVFCFYGFIGLTDSLTAELRGILEGLKILERRRLMGSILATDCQAAYQFVTRQKGGSINNKITAECRDMITECVLLIGDNNIIVEKIEGKRNKCADKLADMAIKEQDDMEYHDVIPREIKSLIDEDKRQLESGGSFTEKAATAATLAAGVAVAAWGISRILSDNTNSDEENDDTAIKSTNPSIRESIRGDRFISTVTDRGYHSTKGQSSGYYGGVISQDDGGSSDVAKQLSTWSPPPRGQFKMNTDGSCKPNPGPSGGYGGILRNNHGDFVYGFYGFIDRPTDGLTAEFIGIHKGLKLLIKLGYTCMGTILETDCQSAEQWINSKDKHKPGKSDIISACWDIIDECRKLKDKYEIDIIKIGEDANKCAHRLAAMGAKEKKIYVEFKDVPYEIKSFVDEDKRLMGC